MSKREKPLKVSQSIRQKVFLIFGSFTLLLTLIYTGMNILVAYIVEDEVLEKMLAYEANVIEMAFQENGRIIQPRVDYMKLYMTPEDAPKEIAQAYKSNVLTSEVFTNNKIHYHIQQLNFNNDISGLLVAEVTPFLTVTNASSEILSIYFLALTVSIAISLWFAFRIATKTTQPISDLTREVMQQKMQAEPLMLSAKNTPDEIGYLAHTIESAMGELKVLLKRESDFNRDVSHELRTPLTVINNTLALADNRLLSKKDVEQLKNTCGKMNNIVSTLVTLARAESISVERFDLRALLEDCVLELHQKLANNDFSVHVDVEGQFQISTNKQLLILLVNNLIENASNYAFGNEMSIKLYGNSLFFENKIEMPIEKRKLTALVEKNVKQEASQGFGQGLYLVRRIVENLGWKFDVLSDGFNFKVEIWIK